MFAKCQACGITASPPTQKVRACTRCFAVGYCSRACQKADWAGHKRRCRPAAGRPAAAAAAACPAPIGGHGVARLEVKRGDDDAAAWEDAGPINLIEETVAGATIPSNESGGDRNTSQPMLNEARLWRDLPTRTRTMLGPASSYEYRHSSDGVDENLLVFFHGAGDSHLPYDALGTRMELPQTARLSLSAAVTLTPRTGATRPSGLGASSFVELPFGLGHSWFAEMDYSTGEALAPDDPRRAASLERATAALHALLRTLTEPVHGGAAPWAPERVFLLGFSAGAGLAHELCRRRAREGRPPLGGAVCVAGGVRTAEGPGTPAAGARATGTRATDVLLVAGARDAAYPEAAARASQRWYRPGKAQVHVQEGKGHAMIEGREEMRAVMAFLAERLVRRLVSMEGQCRRAGG